MDSSLRVVRAHPGLTWRALDGTQAVGAITAFLRPDDRWFIWFDSCRADAYRPLVTAVAGNVSSAAWAPSARAAPSSS